MLSRRDLLVGVAGAAVLATRTTAIRAAAARRSSGSIAFVTMITPNTLVS
jgi:hypothetical protein